MWPIIYWLEKGLMAPGNNTYSLRYPKFLLDVFNPKIKLESPPSPSRQVIYGLDVRRCISWMQIKQWKHCVYQKTLVTWQHWKCNMEWEITDFCVLQKRVSVAGSKESPKEGIRFYHAIKPLNDWSALRKREICWCINCNILSQTE